MKCHYEVLGVSNDCSDEDIKKAYRKLALLWHPDKNRDKAEECTKQFLQIQQSYEVLIDPQERAWYDKHREAILKGGLGRGDEYQDKSLDVYQYFNASCYFGYDDGPQGFYSVYSQVFKTISDEDVEFLDPTSEIQTAPDFGTSQSSYAEDLVSSANVVGPFYAYWESYCTAKSYVWVEKYDTREGPNRQVRRLMEQDNKKLRDKAKKERNEEVRALVGFVRKRDKRVQVYKKKLEERAAEITKLAEEKKERDRQQRLRDMESYKESGWSAMSELESELRALEANVAKQFGEEHSADECDVGDGQPEEAINLNEDEVEDAIDEEYFDDLYCVACNKSFKTDKARENHEKSRKHCDNLARMIEEMRREEAGKHTPTDQTNDDGDDAGLDDEDEQLNVVAPSASKSLSKKQKKKRRQMKNAIAIDSMDEDDSETVNTNDHAVVSDVKCENTESLSSRVVPEATPSQDNEEVKQESYNPPAVENDKPSINSSNKSKKKQAEKITRPPDDTTVELTCHVCRSTFDTRNKLFTHIKATNHALRLDENTVHSNADINKKTNKKRKNDKEKSRK